MSFTDRHIVNAYAEMLEGLNADSKIKLIERLTETLKVEKKTREKSFFKAFGAFASKQSAEEIIADIRNSRKFRKKQIGL